MKNSLLFRITVLLFLFLLNDAKLSQGKWQGLKENLKVSVSKFKQLQQPNGKDQHVASQLQSIISDKEPSMLAINVLTLLFYGTLGTVMPYLPVFYKYLGVTDGDIGKLGAITPAVTFIVSPLWSAIADATGKHRSIMLFTFIGSILSRCVLSKGQNNLFWLSSVVAVSAILNAPVKPLLDSAIMSRLSDKSAYGRSRLYGQLGMGLGSFIADHIVDGNMRSMFLLHLLLSIPTTCLMMIFEPTLPRKQPPSSLSTEKPPTPTVDTFDLFGTLKHTLGNYKVLVFFLVVFIIGVSSGIIENFAYVRLAEISNGDRSAYGPLRLASSLTGGPMFWISGTIIQKFGVHGVMTLSLISYVIRFIIYGFTPKVWYALPAEMLRGFTFALFWSSATYYVYQISPKHLTATMLGILNGVYAGLGQSLGSLIGGELSRSYGIKKSFLYCAGVDLIILIGFIFYQTILHVTDSINGNDNQ